MVVGGVPAGGVGAGRVAGERVGLAAAAAVVGGAERAAAAGVRHPGLASVGVEGLRLPPDPGESTVAHVGLVEVRQRCRGRAGQDRAVRGDGERERTPAAHAGFRRGVHPVGSDPHQLHRSVEEFTPTCDRGPGLLDLFAGRQQGGAVAQRPAVELGVREFDTAGAPPQTEVDQVVQGVEVGAVQHDVEAEGESGGADQPGGALLGRERAGARDAFGDPRIGVLHRELDAAQAGLGEFRHAPLAQPHPAGDQLGVEAGAVRGRDDAGQVASEQGFAAGQVCLYDAEVGSLPEHVGPLTRVQLF